MAAKRDPYEALGVSREASADDIRRAHRKMARELHPDINKAPDAAERFAQIQEAYEILSDPEKRRLFDQFGHAAFDVGAERARAASGAEPRRGATYTWSNVGGSGFGGPSEGFDAEDIGSIFEEFFGARPSGFGGFGGRSGQRREARPTPRTGRDIQHEIAITFYTAAHGGSESLRLHRGGASETIEVRIPKGVADGARLRIRGKGEPGRNGAPPGDLLLMVRVAPHPLFRRDGLDAHFDLPLTIAEAALGASVNVPTPMGETVALKTPPGASSGARLRLRGKGLEDSTGRRGDLYAVVKIMAPAKLSPTDRAALEAMRDRLENPRSGAGWA